MERKVKPNEIICFEQVNKGAWCQETYERVAKRQISTRKKQLEEAGYNCFSFPAGKLDHLDEEIKFTKIHIEPGKNKDTLNIPPVRVDKKMILYSYTINAVKTQLKTLK